MSKCSHRWDFSSKFDVCPMCQQEEIDRLRAEVARLKALANQYLDWHKQCEAERDAANAEIAELREWW